MVWAAELALQEDLGSNERLQARRKLAVVVVGVDLQAPAEHADLDTVE